MKSEPADVSFLAPQNSKEIFIEISYAENAVKFETRFVSLLKPNLNLNYDGINFLIMNRFVCNIYLK
jgi:hypothetical protein